METTTEDTLSIIEFTSTAPNTVTTSTVVVITMGVMVGVAIMAVVGVSIYVFLKKKRRKAARMSRRIDPTLMASVNNNSNKHSWNSVATPSPSSSQHIGRTSAVFGTNNGGSIAIDGSLVAPSSVSSSFRGGGSSSSVSREQQVLDMRRSQIVDNTVRQSGTQYVAAPNVDRVSNKQKAVVQKNQHYAEIQLKKNESKDNLVIEPTKKLRRSDSSRRRAIAKKPAAPLPPEVTLARQSRVMQGEVDSSARVSSPTAAVDGDIPYRFPPKKKSSRRHHSKGNVAVVVAEPEESPVYVDLVVSKDNVARPTHTLMAPPIPATMSSETLLLEPIGVTVMEIPTLAEFDELPADERPKATTAATTATNHNDNDDDDDHHRHHRKKLSKKSSTKLVSLLPDAEIQKSNDVAPTTPPANYDSAPVAVKTFDLSDDESDALPVTDL